MANTYSSGTSLVLTVSVLNSAWTIAYCCQPLREPAQGSRLERDGRHQGGQDLPAQLCGCYSPTLGQALPCQDETEPKLAGDGGTKPQPAALRVLTPGAAA